MATTIPILDLTPALDDQCLDADFHYHRHDHLTAHFGLSVDSHHHDDYFQIHYMQQGYMHLYLDDREYRLQGPFCVLTPPGVAHGFVTLPDTRGEVLTVRQHLVWQMFEAEPELLPRLHQPLCGILLGDVARTATVRTERIGSLFSQIAEESVFNLPGREANLQALLRLLLCELLRMAVQSGSQRPAALRDLQQFHGFSQLLARHLDQHWSLAQYAERIGITTARLNQLCRRFTGRSPKQLIIDRRIRAARQLLLHSAEHIDQISFSLGFHDPAYFSRFFSHHTGLSPKAFRSRSSADR